MGCVKTVKNTDGVKKIPHILTIIIAYYRKIALKQEFRKCMSDVRYDITKFDRVKYEKNVIKVRDRFNDIINFYHDDFESYLKRNNILNVYK